MYEAQAALEDRIAQLEREREALIAVVRRDQAIMGKLVDLLVDASYLMQHFKESDAAYKGWRGKGQQILADARAALIKHRVCSHADSSRRSSDEREA